MPSGTTVLLPCKDNTSYEDGYEVTSQVCVWFWEIALESFDEEARKSTGPRIVCQAWLLFQICFVLVEPEMIDKGVIFD